MTAAQGVSETNKNMSTSICIEDHVLSQKVSAEFVTKIIPQGNCKKHYPMFTESCK